MFFISLIAVGLVVGLIAYLARTTPQYRVIFDSYYYYPQYYKNWGETSLWEYYTDEYKMNIKFKDEGQAYTFIEDEIKKYKMKHPKHIVIKEWKV